MGLRRYTAGMFAHSIGPDALSVLRSTRPVAESARWVTIDLDAVERTAALLAEARLSPPEWEEGLHFRDGSWRTAAFVLVLDALNFCFWSVGPERWRVEYQGEVFDGYWALVAALRRAVDAGVPLWDAEWLSSASFAELRSIFAPADLHGPPIPLLEARIANLREVGYGLQEMPIEELLGLANGSAAALVEEVVRRFPSFDDRVTIDGNDVRFYKRAQILVADLHGAFGGDGLGRFDDLDQLTAFADYKVPQVLRRFGVLCYAPELEDAIRAHQLIPAGSPWEVEIRAATVWGCELIRHVLMNTEKPLRSFEIDWALWLTGQSLPPGTEPYHRTPTIFY